MNNYQAEFHRQSVRLQGYDYTQQGAYYVTIVTQQRDLFFEDSRIRAVAEECWRAIPEHSPVVDLDAWVIMPNHLHGIIVIGERQANGESGRDVQLNVLLSPPNVQSSPQSRNSRSKFSTISPFAGSLAVLMRTYKAAVTSICRQKGFTEFAWQSRFYDHIIRDEADLNRIRQYIIDNPAKWDNDEENPKRGKK